MLISALQTKGIFCAHCEIGEDAIAVGWMAIRDLSLLGSVVSLAQSENKEGDRFLVRIPDQLKNNPDIKVILERVNDRAERTEVSPAL